MDDISRPKKSLREVLPRAGLPGTATGRHEFNHYRGLENSLPPPPTPLRSVDVDDGWRGGRYWLLIGAVVVVVALAAGFTLSKVLAQATVRVTPVQGRLLLNHTFEAKANPAVGELGFTVVSGLSDVEKRTLPASGSEQVTTKASGKLTIYNTYFTASQKLIANTRFQSPDNKIFRISSAVTVPGTKKDASGKVIPGSVEVTVTADQAGADYNIGPGQFSIPGFKGDPRFGKIYGQSMVAMSGGFAGQVKKIDETTKDAARTEMQNALRERLNEEAKLETPADFVLFPDATYFTFDESVTAPATSTNSAEFAVTGHLYGLLFKRSDLAKYIASQLIPNYDGHEMMIANLDKLTFQLASKETLVDPNLDQVSFTLNGNAALVSLFDQTDLIKKLTTATSTNYEQIFAQYPNIDKAQIVFRPPWLRTVPTDPKRVRVELVIEGVSN